MKLLFGHAWWGVKHYGWQAMVGNIKSAGFDFAEIYIPASAKEEALLFDLLHQAAMPFVIHHYQAHGNNFNGFAYSYQRELEKAVVKKPLLVNSHTGKDYFSFTENLTLLKIADDISRQSGVKIVHETHRGRCLYSAPASKPFFEALPNLLINADFSHWCCVSESLLEGQETTVQSGISRSHHIHARIGHAQGPQISDPRNKYWQKEKKQFLFWWQQIISARSSDNIPYLTITPEFGPPPYQWINPVNKTPLGDIFEMNTYMMQWLKTKLVM